MTIQNYSLYESGYTRTLRWTREMCAALTYRLVLSWEEHNLRDAQLVTGIMRNSAYITVTGTASLKFLMPVPVR